VIGIFLSNLKTLKTLIVLSITRNSKLKKNEKVIDKKNGKNDNKSIQFRADFKNTIFLFAFKKR
jgi:hypothetical protein